MQRTWQDKLAAGFTISGSMSGDTANAAVPLRPRRAARHALGQSRAAPGWNTTTSTDDDNRLGFCLGAWRPGSTRGPDAVLTGAPRVTSAAAS